MELILLCINILLLIVIWRFCVRKTILDHHRDALFDLRDALRKKYVENSWNLGDPTYQHLRDLVNGCLRFTESYSLIGVVFLQFKIQNEDELQKYLKKKLEKEFHSKDYTAEQHRFVQELRATCKEIIQSYMILSSGWLLVISLLLVPIIAILGLVKVMQRGAGAALQLMGKKVTDWNETLSVLHHKVARLVASLVASPDLVEEYSYRLGLQSCHT